jgi:hypothetical protein
MLKHNSVLQELDVSDNYMSTPSSITDGPGFAQELAVGLSDNGALSRLSLKSNYLRPDGGKALAEGLKGNQAITELNIADNLLGFRKGSVDMSGIIALADVIPDMRALTVLDVSNNQIGFLAHAEWSDTGQGGSYTTGRRYQHVDGRKQDDKPEGVEFKPLGVIILADAIKDMGAMTSLNLASNELGAEGAKIVAEAIKVTKCTPAIILVPFSCPSDFSINCCCLLLSAGYEGDDEPQSCKQRYLLVWQHGWDQGHFQSCKGACDHFGTIFISI